MKKAKYMLGAIAALASLRARHHRRRTGSS